MNNNFINNCYDKFIEDVTSRKLVAYGAVTNIAEIMSSLKLPIDRIEYIIDKDVMKHYTAMNGIPICPVEKLMDEIPDDIVVLIMIRSIYSAQKTLKCMGVRNYYAYYVFVEIILDNGFQLINLKE